MTHNWMQRAKETGFLPPSDESLMDEREDGTDEGGDPECSMQAAGTRWMHLIYICSF